MKNRIALFAASLTVLLISLQPGQVLSQTDPDYQNEVENNTICSFINSNNVNVRQDPSTQSPIVTQLNRGDGVRALGRDGDWVQLAALDSGIPPEPYSTLYGWVSNQYINGCSEDQFEMWRE